MSEPGGWLGSESTHYFKGAGNRISPRKINASRFVGDNYDDLNIFGELFIVYWD